MERKLIKSGVPGLDGLMGGGLLEGSILTVSGPTGSGKSTLAAQFIYNGARESDEAGVYIAIEESRRDFFFHMGGFSFDFEGLEKDRKFVFLDYPVHEVDQIINQSNAIFEIIRNTGARRVVIDSIMPIALYFHGEEDRKKGFLKFIENLRKWNVTVLIVTEDLKMTDQQGSPSSEYGIESFTDGWINLFYRYDEKSMERKRYLEVIKMKGSAHSSKSVPVSLGSDGLAVGVVPKPVPEAAPVPRSVLPPSPPPAPQQKPEEEDIDKLVETVFAMEPALKPKARAPPPPPVPKAAEQRPAQEPKPAQQEAPAIPPVLTRKLAASAIGPKGPPPKPPPSSGAPKAPPPKPAPAKAALKPKAQPKAPPARQAPPPGPAPRTAPAKAPAARGARPAAAAKAAPQKPAAQPGSRPPPAKMSDSIAERIAEAKKRIMKKGL